MLATAPVTFVLASLAQSSDQPIYEIDPGVAFVGTLISVAIGAWIGSTRGRTLLGAVLGFLCGCIGWIIVAVLPKRNRY